MDLSFLASLEKVNWKRLGATVFKIAIQPKVFGLAGLLIFVLYGITWDTVLRPSLETMQKRDALIASQHAELTKKENNKRQYTELERQLRDLHIDMLAIHSGNSSTVLAVSEAANLLALAQGKVRAQKPWPPLPAPHNRRSGVTLTPVSSSSVDLRTLLDPKTLPSLETDSVTSHPETANAKPTPIPAERFDYDLKASGTYPALMDLLNELTTYDKLVKINKVTVLPGALYSPSQPLPPDAKDYPDFPVVLDMTVSLSLFLYEDNSPAPQSASSGQ